MKSVSVQQAKQLVDVLDFLTPRQRKYFINTMNTEQRQIFELACFNLAPNYQGPTTKQVAILKKYKRQVEVVASKDYMLTDKSHSQEDFSRSFFQYLLLSQRHLHQNEYLLSGTSF